MTTIHLLAALLHHLHALVPALPPALRLNLALLMLALAQSPNCHLATLATVLPVDAQRENLIQWLRRWLATRPLTWRTVYASHGQTAARELEGRRDRPGDGPH